MGVPYAEVIGDPVAHSKSPIIHKFWLEALGIEGDYRRVHVRAEELSAYLGRRREDPNWRGGNVTIPHKQTVLSLLDVIQDDGIGAINCILPQEGRLVGRNTDERGVSRILSKAFGAGGTLSHPVCLIGAGGAARAAMAALRTSAVPFVNILARERARGEALLRDFKMSGGVYLLDKPGEALGGAIGLINATPCGMTGAPPMAAGVLTGLESMHRDAFVFDMVYAPLSTDLLAKASKVGLDIFDGLEMLLAQAEEAFRLFFAAEPPGSRLPELRELLAR